MISMTSAKEKDRILAQIKAFKPHNEIERLSEHIYDLERNGYVSVWRDEQSRPITVRLTPHGENFLYDGGYSAKKRRMEPKIKSIGKGVWGFVLTVISGLIIAYLSKRLGWI